MAVWYRLDLGNGHVAHGQTTKLQDAFMEVLLRAPPDSDMALFSSYDREADNVQIYFTPGASNLAAAFGAKPCEKPVPGKYKIGLLAGSSDALSRHFPDR